MSALLWLIAGVNLTIAFSNYPEIAYSNLIPGLICLTMGAFIK
jgi:hypothetical protein